MAFGCKGEPMQIQRSRDALRSKYSDCIPVSYVSVNCDVKRFFLCERIILPVRCFAVLTVIPARRPREHEEGETRGRERERERRNIGVSEIWPKVARKLHLESYHSQWTTASDSVRHLIQFRDHQRLRLSLISEGVENSRINTARVRFPRVPPVPRARPCPADQRKIGRPKVAIPNASSFPRNWREIVGTLPRNRRTRPRLAVQTRLATLRNAILNGRVYRFTI